MYNPIILYNDLVNTKTSVGTYVNKATHIISMVWVCTASVLEATAPTFGLTRKLPLVFISVNNLRESSRLEEVERLLSNTCSV